MTNKTVIVSAGDQKYFPLLKELIDSILVHDQSRNVDIAVMNVGMTFEQVSDIKSRGVLVVEPEWPCYISPKKIEGKEYLRACVCRPFINKIFPGYDIYIWLDTDTWLQDWETIELYEAGARKGSLACTVQVDRGYPGSSRIKWIGNFPWKARGFYYANAKRAFSKKIAKSLFHHHTIQAGAFALHKDAPHWDHWQKLIVKALEKGKVFTAEQLTMGMMIHLDKLPAEFLPAYCNWIHTKELLWDNKQEAFVEPFLPHHKIGLLHLTGLDEMRVDSTIKEPIKTTDGNIVEMSLRYNNTQKKLAA